MNAISWIVGHLAWHWIWGPFRHYFDTDRGMPYADLLERLQPFRDGSDDPTPPALDDVRQLLEQAKSASLELIAQADDLDLATIVGSETMGTKIMRCSFHTMVHGGEIIAIRQILGHPEIVFVSRLTGRLEWRPVPRPVASR